jgi:HEAT repeat protein
MSLFGKPDIEKLKTKRNIEGLIKALGNKKYADVRWQSARVLEQLGDKRAIEPLIQALNDDHGLVRKSAIEALGKIGDERATEALIAGLNDQDDEIRLSAVNSLKQIGDEHATKLLITVLKDKNTDVRISAASALGQIGGGHAAMALIDALNDKNAKVRESVTYALRKIDDDAIAEISETAVERLIAALKDPVSDIRKVMVRALGQMGDDRALEPLVEALQDESNEVRQSAALALEKLNWNPDKSGTGAHFWIAKQQWDKCVEIGSPAVEPLISMLRHPHENVRHSVVNALVQIGKDRTLDALYLASKNKNEIIRRNAVYTLVKMGEDRIVRDLIELLKSHSQEVRAEVISEIARLSIRSDEILPELTHKLVDRSEKVKMKAAKALWQLNRVDSAIRFLRNEYKDQGNMSKDEVLGGINVLKENADDKSIFQKLIENNWSDWIQIESAVRTKKKKNVTSFINDLLNIKSKIHELRRKHPGPASASISGPLSDIIDIGVGDTSIICRDIDDAIKSLRTGNHWNRPITPEEVAQNLMKQIESARNRAGLKIPELDFFGEQKLNNVIEELGQICKKIY